MCICSVLVFVVTLLPRRRRLSSSKVLLQGACPEASRPSLQISPAVSDGVEQSVSHDSWSYATAHLGSAPSAQRLGYVYGSFSHVYLLLCSQHVNRCLPSAPCSGHLEQDFLNLSTVYKDPRLDLSKTGALIAPHSHPLLSHACSPSSLPCVRKEQHQSSRHQAESTEPSLVTLIRMILCRQIR